MPIDSSIYRNAGQLKMPSMQEAVNVGHSYAKMNEYKRQSANAEQDRSRSMAETAAIKDVFQKNRGNPKAIYSEMSRINPGKAMEYQKSVQGLESGRLGNQSKTIANQGAEFNQKFDQAKVGYRMASAAVDEGSYQKMIGTMHKMGMKTEHLPPNYDPGMMQQLKHATMTQVEEMTAQKNKFFEMNANRKAGLDQKKFGLDQRKQAHNEKKETAGVGFKLSKAQESVDREYGKHYAKFSGKGAVNAKVAIERLEGLADEMEKDQGPLESGGGRFAEYMPDALRSRDAIRRRDQARNFANTTLKELFGGQLSDGERIAAAKEYYIDSQDNKTNAKVIRDKVEALKLSYQNEVNRARYYETAGTIVGFEGTPGDGGLTKSGRLAKQSEQEPNSGSMGMNSATASETPAFDKMSTEDLMKYLRE